MIGWWDTPKSPTDETILMKVKYFIIKSCGLNLTESIILSKCIYINHKTLCLVQISLFDDEIYCNHEHKKPLTSLIITAVLVFLERHLNPNKLARSLTYRNKKVVCVASWYEFHLDFPYTLQLHRPNLEMCEDLLGTDGEIIWWFRRARLGERLELCERLSYEI